MVDLFDFLPDLAPPPPPPVPCTAAHSCTDRAQIIRDRTVLVTPFPLTSWFRAITVASEALQRYPAVWLTSNGSEDVPATEWMVRGCMPA
jgi:hypothetical protein